MFICLFVLFGCKVGEFPENRNRLHEMGTGEEVCKTHPERCLNGTPW